MGSMGSESVQALVLHGAKDLKLVSSLQGAMVSAHEFRKQEHHSLHRLAPCKSQ